MDKQQRQQRRQQQPQAQHRPGHGLVFGVQVQDAHAGGAEQHAGDGKNVNEPAPGCAGVAAFVQVVEVRNPAPVGALVSAWPSGRLMRSQASPPGRGRDRYTSSSEEFGLAPGGGNLPGAVQPGLQGRGRGAWPVGKSCSSAAGTCACRWVTWGRPSISAAWFSVKPVMENSSMVTRLTAALTQCHWCKVFSQRARTEGQRWSCKKGGQLTCKAVHSSESK